MYRNDYPNKEEEEENEIMHLNSLEADRDNNN